MKSYCTRKIRWIRPLTLNKNSNHRHTHFVRITTCNIMALSPYSKYYFCFMTQFDFIPRKYTLYREMNNKWCNLIYKFMIIIRILQVRRFVCRLFRCRLNYKCISIRFTCSSIFCNHLIFLQPNKIKKNLEQMWINVIITFLSSAYQTIHYVCSHI